MKSLFHGNVHKGKLKLDRRGEFDQALIPFEGRQVSIALSKRQSIRSLNQNSYFHGVICELISEKTGYEPEEVKEILKQKFLLIDDSNMPRCRPTSSLNTEEMSRFIEQCIRWAAMELQLVIPDIEKVSV